MHHVARHDSTARYQAAKSLNTRPQRARARQVFGLTLVGPLRADHLSTNIPNQTIPTSILTRTNKPVRIHVYTLTHLRSQKQRTHTHTLAHLKSCRACTVRHAQTAHTYTLPRTRAHLHACTFTPAHTRRAHSTHSTNDRYHTPHHLRHPCRPSTTVARPHIFDLGV